MYIRIYGSTHRLCASPRETHSISCITWMYSCPARSIAYMKHSCVVLRVCIVTLCTESCRQSCSCAWVPHNIVLDSVMYTNVHIMVLINPISLYSLYAFHRTQEWFISVSQYLIIDIQRLLIYGAVEYTTRWIIILPHAFQKCYMRGKDIKQYWQVPPPPTDLLCQKYEKGQWGTGGYRSNPSTINLREVQTRIEPATNRGMLHQTIRTNGSFRNGTI